MHDLMRELLVPMHLRPAMRAWSQTLTLGAKIPICDGTELTMSTDAGDEHWPPYVETNCPGGRYIYTAGLTYCGTCGFAHGATGRSADEYLDWRRILSKQ